MHDGFWCEILVSWNIRNFVNNTKNEKAKRKITILRRKVFRMKCTYVIKNQNIRLYYFHFGFESKFVFLSIELQIDFNLGRFNLKRTEKQKKKFSAYMINDKTILIRLTFSVRTDEGNSRV